MPIIILPLIVFATVAFIVIAFSAPSESAVQSRLRTYGYHLAGRDLSIPFATRVIMPAFEKLAGLVTRFSPMRFESDIRTQLTQAGSPAGLDGSKFLAVKAIAGVGLASFALVTPILGGQIEIRTFIIAIVLGVLGWKVP